MTDEDKITMAEAEYQRLKQAAGRNTTHKVSESADKIVLKPKS